MGGRLFTPRNVPLRSSNATGLQLLSSRFASFSFHPILFLSFFFFFWFSNLVPIAGIFVDFDRGASSFDQLLIVRFLRISK